jgi:Domain of unknown function (DUF397)
MSGLDSPDGWHKSRFCDSGNCVEVKIAAGEDRVLLRRGGDGVAVGHVVEFTFAEWTAFTLGVLDGEFQLP